MSVSRMIPEEEAGCDDGADTDGCENAPQEDFSVSALQPNRLLGKYNFSDPLYQKV